MYIQTNHDCGVIYKTEKERERKHLELQPSFGQTLNTSKLFTCYFCKHPYHYRNHRSFRCENNQCKQIEYKFKTHLKKNNNFQITTWRTETEIWSQNELYRNPDRGIVSRQRVGKSHIAHIPDKYIPRATLEVLFTGITGREQRQFLNAKPEDLTFTAYYQLKIDSDATLQQKCVEAINLAFVKNWLTTEDSRFLYRPSFHTFTEWVEKLVWSPKVRNWILEPRRQFFTEEMFENLSWTFSGETVELVAARY